MEDINDDELSFESENMFDDSDTNIEDDFEFDEPIMDGDPRRDRRINPWIDEYGEGDDAEIAYWNTH